MQIHQGEICITIIMDLILVDGQRYGLFCNFCLLLGNPKDLENALLAISVRSLHGNFVPTLGLLHGLWQKCKPMSSRYWRKMAVGNLNITVKKLQL